MAEVKTTKKVVAKKTTETKTATPKSVKKEIPTTDVAAGGLTVDLFDTTGVVTGKIALPEEMFGAKINKELIAQAVRVYLANQRRGSASTKTRGEVDGSTRKIYRQKGTGRARHGGIRAPIFVKGGIAHGPKPKDFSLSMPKKMKKAAFESALSAQLRDGAIMVVSGAAKLAIKTKEFATMFEKLAMPVKKRSVLFILPKHITEMVKGVRNLTGVDVTTVQQVNTYELLSHKKIIFMEEAIDTFAKEHTK